VSDRYDLCVLGAGPAGFAAAIRAFDLGKRVLLVEAGEVGGTGLAAGALSSKTMWHLANDYAKARRKGRGFHADAVEVSYPRITEGVADAVGERRALLLEQLSKIAAPASGRGQVELARGYGRFDSSNSIRISGGDGSRSVHADYFLIATGSQPRMLAGVEPDGERIVTSDHIESWKSFPSSLVIVGSGVVGCEYATIFGHYGRTKIFMIDRRDRILPFEDEDIATCIGASFESMGITIHRKAKLKSLAPEGDGVRYVIERDGVDEVHHVERALISIGRVPRTSDLGLENAGVELDERCGIKTDGVRTNIPNIFAAGDATLDVALANIAELEGRQAVEAMFDLAPKRIRYDALSTIMFLEPEVAAVGYGEQSARENGIAYRAAKVENRLISRNIAMRNTKGFIKLLAAPDNTVLGLRVVGPQASSCIQGIAFLMELGAKLEDIDRCVHPHPAVTEGVQECARLLLGRSLLKPEYVDGATVVEFAP